MPSILRECKRKQRLTQADFETGSAEKAWMVKLERLTKDQEAPEGQVDGLLSGDACLVIVALGVLRIDDY